MTCFTQCQELEIYNYKINNTVNIKDCECKGCCYNIYSFFQFIYISFFIFTMILFCNMSSKNNRKIIAVPEERINIMQAEEAAPAYTENT